MPTYILCVRRHHSQIAPLAHALLSVLGYNKNILDLVLANASLKETAEVVMELLALAEQSRQEKEVTAMFNFDEFLRTVVDSLRSSELFASCGHLLLKLLHLNCAELADSK